MLNLIRCSQPEIKRSLFADFNPTQQTWIVSDLQSKWHLQRVLLGAHGVLEERAILRATELWQQFAFQLLPETRMLSHELAQTLFWNWIEPMGLPWARSPQAVPVLLNQMQMWMSIFADPQHEEIMAQWFADNPESYVRWGHWFELCAQIWRRCQEQNLVMVAWLPAMILNQNLDDLRWTQSLTFDLGPQISQVEGLLLKELGKRFAVNVIFPEAPWIGLMKNALRPYADLRKENGSGDADWQPSVDQSLEFGRFSTQLAEVKDSVARVRAWLDLGVEPRQIAVVAPDIEHYWPVLKLYLAEEGIPVCKAETARLRSFTEIAQWMSSLRIALSKISASDLEVHFFTEQNKPRISFDEFRVLFSHVYDHLDLNRARRLFGGAGSDGGSGAGGGAPPAHAALTIEEFLLWAIQLWPPAADTTRLVALLQIVGQEVPREMSLRPSQWLSYAEGLVARREITLKPAHESGIWCVSVSSADWLEVSHGVFLNLCESALRRVESSPVRASEAQKIFTDTGFALGTTDRQELEFEFLWFLKRDWSELQLNFAGTDFQGGVLTPSRFWMWAGFTNDKLKIHPQAPRFTRWDEIQHLPTTDLAKFRGLNEAWASGLGLGLARDLSTGISTWRPDPQVRVSASSLEKFWGCPFIFAAQRKLKLNDDPALDLDVDRRTRGNLLHALVEELLCDPPRWEWSDEQLAELVDSLRAKQEILVGDERLWPAVRSQHVRLGRMFLDFERNWRERFPLTRTVGRESSFACYWDMATGLPSKNVTGLVLAGRLDRVDQDSQGRYALIDYKGSSTALRNWKSWLSHHEIQLALYSLLIELGLTEHPPGAVVAANYFVVKDADRRKGFHLRASDSELYASEDRHLNFISEPEKQELYLKLREEIQDALTEIMDGKLNPHPVDEKICGDCAWRTLCRAPHLN